MKVCNVIRMQMMVAGLGIALVLLGLGAALLLASSAHAHQDLEPTHAVITLGTHKIDKGAAVRTAETFETANKERFEGDALLSLWSTQNTREEMSLAQLALLDTMIVVILMIGVGFLVLYATAATKRERRLH
jgi:hypothetical protein